MLDKNKIICVNDTDENPGAANADTADVKTGCRRQLYGTLTHKNYLKRQKSSLEMSNFNLKASWKNIYTEEFFLLKKLNSFCFVWRVQDSIFLYYLENFEKSRSRKTNCTRL